MKKELFIFAGALSLLMLGAGGVVWYLHGWRLQGSDLELHESWSAREREAIQQIEAALLRDVVPIPRPECVEDLPDYWRQCVAAREANLDELRTFRLAAATGRGDVYSALGLQPMWYAVAYDHFELARAFVNRGADPTHSFYLEEGDLHADVIATLVGRVHHGEASHSVEKSQELLNWLVEERGVDVRKSPREGLLRFALTSCVAGGGDAGAMMAWVAEHVQPLTEKELEEVVGCMVSLNGTLPGLLKMQQHGLLPSHIFSGEKSVLRCIRFRDKECEQKVEWILEQKPTLPGWEVELSYIEDAAEWNRAMACCRLVLQAGIRIDVPENRHPVNPVYREEFRALLREFGQPCHPCEFRGNTSD